MTKAIVTSKPTSKASVVPSKAYMKKSLSDCWGTPAHILDQHKGYFDPTPFPTPTWDGLKTNWLQHKKIFCNPPYSNIAPFAKKCKDTLLEAQAKNISIEIHLLILSRTDTRYFHDHVYPYATLDFIKGRLKFRDLTGVSKKPTSAPFPSVMCVYQHVATPYSLKQQQLLDANERACEAMENGDTEAEQAAYEDAFQIMNQLTDAELSEVL